jgi:hypothetical protein
VDSYRQLPTLCIAVVHRGGGLTLFNVPILVLTHMWWHFLNKTEPHLVAFGPYIWVLRSTDGCARVRSAAAATLPGSVIERKNVGTPRGSV